MIDLQNIVRPNVLALTPYSSARDEFSGKADVYLDANENPYGELNRYPDPYQKELKNELSVLKKIDAKNIFIGNGSDEVIDLAFRLFCNPGADKALAFTPTYGMYDVSAAINDVELIKVPLNQDFQIDLEKVVPYLTNSNVKLIFICSPNNPTGNLMNKNDIETLLIQFEGIVILDEAYIDFAEKESLLQLTKKYTNLIIIQTFSKSWGLASARIGCAYADDKIIALFNLIKPPYNISGLNQEAALKALKNIKYCKENILNILSEKKELENSLKSILCVKKVYPSDANFMLIEVTNADKVYQELVTEKIITRNRNKQVLNCIRISVGTPEENKQLINALIKIK